MEYYQHFYFLSKSIIDLKNLSLLSSAEEKLQEELLEQERSLEVLSVQSEDSTEESEDDPDSKNESEDDPDCGSKYDSLLEVTSHPSHLSRDHLLEVMFHEEVGEEEEEEDSDNDPDYVPWQFREVVENGTKITSSIIYYSGDDSDVGGITVKLDQPFAKLVESWECSATTVLVDMEIDYGTDEEGPGPVELPVAGVNVVAENELQIQFTHAEEQEDMFREYTFELTPANTSEPLIVFKANEEGENDYKTTMLMLH